MRKLWLYLVMVLILILLFIASLQIGIVHLHASLWSLIGKHDGIDATTVWEIRFPRALGAVIVGDSPTEFTTFLKRDHDRWESVIKAAAIKPDDN